MDFTNSNRKNQDYSVSADKAKLDLEVIHDFLSNHAYWAIGRSKETIRRSIQNSFCIGIYDKQGCQVAFARMVTDYAVFGYIMDVFVLPEHRKKGLGKMLMDFLIRYEEFRDLKRIVLGTQDAQGLYEQFGFKALEKPDNWMEYKRF
jgi:ribosomal protein S18 acetylase RimI-like enzyme